MSTQQVRDYLTKQVFIQNNIVTYRTLSCALQIHVNAAKNELATFHAVKTELGQSVAVYLVSGQKATPVNGEDDKMEGELQEEEPSRLEFVLVSESELSRVKEEFIKIQCIHVYSLSASVIHEPALLCGDGGMPQEPVGNIVSEDVKLRKGKSKVKYTPKVEPAPVEKKPVIKKEATVVDKPEKQKPKELKPKPSGKLDFSKAKTKEQKAQEKAEAEAKQRAEREASKAKVAKDSDSKPTIVKKVKENQPKEDVKAASSKQRGTKRKVLLSSDSEVNESGEESSSSTRAIVSKAKTKIKPTVWSDEDDSDGPPQKRLIKGKKVVKRAIEEDEEEEASGLMDIADDEVDDLTHRETPVPSTAPPTEDEPILSDSDVDPVPKKKVRKPKKVVPVGRNGVKKRRVMKTRITKDAKGYNVREDYSSYESVDSGDELVKEPVKKTKTKTKAPADSGDESSDKRDTSAKDTEMEVDKSKPKKQTLTKRPSTSSASTAKKTASSSSTAGPKGKKVVPGQSKLSTFFGPPKTKN